MTNRPKGLTLPLLGAAMFALLPCVSQNAAAQGCVAAHSPQPIITGLSPNSQQRVADHLHGLTVTVGYRTYNSFRHYVGTVYQVQRQTNHNAVVNHVNLFNLDLSYQLTPRVSLIADLPGMTASRAGQGNPNVYRSAGIGDVTIGAETWLWRPPTESHGNIAFSTSLKLPTGYNDAKGTKLLSNGQTMIEPFDESIQPGDGTWGFALGTEAYRETYFHTVGYFTGSWLFSPQDVTGVKTFRGAPGEGVVSATDQYLWRGGFSHAVPLPMLKPQLRGLALALADAWKACPSAMPSEAATDSGDPVTSSRLSQDCPTPTVAA